MKSFREYTSLERATLSFMLFAFAVLSFYRWYTYWTTGFFVSDEFGYAYDAMHGTIYGDRWFFGWFNLIIFRLLGINSTNHFANLLPFYTFAWSAATIAAFYKIMRNLGLDKRTITLALFSSLFLVSFVLLSLGFLTEPVGLCMAMLGVYFMVKFAKQEKSLPRVLVYPLLSALTFAAAAGTREPYNILLVGGPVVALLIAMKLRRSTELPTGRSRWAVPLFAFLFFAVPSGVFLVYPNNIIANQINPIAASVPSSVQPVPITQTSVTTTTRVVTIRTTSTAVINGTTTEVVINVTSTTTETSTVGGQVTSPSLIQRILHFRASNTFVIFFGGLLLGWGPLLFGISLFGLYTLAKRSRKRSLESYLLLLSALTAGSYLVVSYIYAPDPNYFSFSNYSTIIRFSDTALPACFLTLPFASSVFARSRKFALAIVAVLLVFLIVAVPAYETYAASNISYVSQNPFTPGYITPAAQIRDYVHAHSADAPFHIVGVPYGWVFTPGVETLRSVQVYDTSANPLVPSINYSQFVQHRWTTVYVYGDANLEQIRSGAPYLYSLFEPNSTPSNANAALPYSLVNRQLVIQGNGYVFWKLQLSWH